MERSVIRDYREASMPPRISLRSIRAILAALSEVAANHRYGAETAIAAAIVPIYVAFWARVAAPKIIE
jgi:hypothetical protein